MTDPLRVGPERRLRQAPAPRSPPHLGLSLFSCKMRTIVRKSGFPARWGLGELKRGVGFLFADPSITNVG